MSGLAQLRSGLRQVRVDGRVGQPEELHDLAVAEARQLELEDAPAAPAQLLGQALDGPGARRTHSRAGRPQTNGHVEALHKTILDECWRPAFARYLQPRITGLRRDLDGYLSLYDFERVQTGRLSRGQVPAEIVYGARKMEAR